MSSVLSNKATKLFLVLSGFFVCNALVAEMIGVKIFSFEKVFGFDSMNWTILGVTDLGFNLTAGVLLWPVVFVMTDIINEYFGKKGVVFLSYMTAGLIVFAFIVIFAAIALPPNDWWTSISGTNIDNPRLGISNMNLAFKKIFGQGLWIIVGSLVAFLVGQLIDVYVFQKIKQKTGEGKVWLRATGSTLVSQCIDSFIVLFIAFYIGADWGLVRVLAIGIVNYIYKFGVAVILTPVIYLAHHFIDNYLGENLASQLKQEALLK